MKHDIHLRIDSSNTSGTAWEEFTDSPHPVWAEVEFGPWRAGLRIQHRDGQPVLTELRVYPTDPDGLPGEWSREVARVPSGGLRPDFVKNLSLGSLRDQAMQQLVDPEHATWKDGWTNPAENWHDIAGLAGIEAGADADTPTRPGRRPLSDEQLAFVAACYVEALSDGKKANRHVHARVREFEPDVTLAAVIGRIHKARNRGFLTKATKSGRREGRLTEKTVHVLDRMELKMKEQQ